MSFALGLEGQPCVVACRLKAVTYLALGRLNEEGGIYNETDYLGTDQDVE